MAEPLTSILGAALIAVVAGSIGKSWGGNGKVGDKTCKERQHSVQEILTTKIDNVAEKLEDLTKAVNNKLLGL